MHLTGYYGLDPDNAEEAVAMLLEKILNMFANGRKEPLTPIELREKIMECVWACKGSFHREFIRGESIGRQMLLYHPTRFARLDGTEHVSEGSPGRERKLRELAKEIPEVVSETCRTALEMWLFHNMSFKEIAEDLDISLRAARYRIRTALEILKAKREREASEQRRLDLIERVRASTTTPSSS